MAKLAFENRLKFKGMKEIVCGELWRDKYKFVTVRFSHTTVSLYSFKGYYHPPKKEGEWIISYKNLEEFAECLDMLLI